MKPPMPDAGYWDRKKAEFAAEHKAWHDERGAIVAAQHIEPSKDFDVWAWQRDHPGEQLPEFMRDWRDMHWRFENGSHAQPDTHTDRQNERDDREAVDRRVAEYQPSRTASDKPVRRRKAKAARVDA